MKAEREIPIEDEPDEPFPSEYEPNELHQIMVKKGRKYLALTDSKGRGGGGGGALKYTKQNNLIYV